MDKWLLNTKKIKLTVVMVDTNDTEETEMCANGACSTVPTKSCLKIMMDIFQSTGQNISGMISLIHTGC
jgi:hypothetical protein